MTERVGDWTIEGVKPDTVSEFKKGQSITCILYNGNSRVIASGIYEYVRTSYINGTPMPVRGTPFKLSINDFKIFEKFEPSGYRDIYEVKVKGELV